MSKHIAFIRAVSAGGRAAVHMSELKDAFAAAGCSDVTTHVQSGNVVFEVPDEQASTIVEAIQRELEKVLGHEPGVMLRTPAELRRLVKSAPFDPLTGDSDTQLYVALLSARPRRKPAFPIRLPGEGLEAIGMLGGDVFVVSRRKASGGFGFPNDFVEQTFGVPATTRSWSTITKLVEVTR